MYQESSAQLVNAVKLTEQIDDLKLRGEVLTEYALILQQLAEYDEAEKVLKQIIQLWETAKKTRTKGLRASWTSKHQPCRELSGYIDYNIFIAIDLQFNSLLYDVQ